MASCFGNIRTKNYQNLIMGFQVTVENVGDAFLGHSVQYKYKLQPHKYCEVTLKKSYKVYTSPDVKSTRTLSRCRSPSPIT